MPDQLNLFDVLLGRTKPNPDMRPVFTPQDQAPPSVLDPAIDFVRGLGYFPTEPVPQDAGGAYGAGAALAAGAPLVGAFSKWRPVVSELNSIIGDYQPIDSLQTALMSRVTPRKIFPAKGVTIPEGFALPEEFGPNKLTRPGRMYVEEAKQRAIPMPQPKNRPVFNPSGKSATKRLQTYEAPTAGSFEEAKDFAKPEAAAPERKKIIGGGSSRRNPAGRLTQTQVGQLKGMIQAGVDHATIAKQFGVETNYVGQIARGESWNRVRPIPVEKTGQ